MVHPAASSTHAWGCKRHRCPRMHHGESKKQKEPWKQRAMWLKKEMSASSRGWESGDVEMIPPLPKGLQGCLMDNKPIPVVARSSAGQQDALRDKHQDC